MIGRLFIFSVGALMLVFSAGCGAHHREFDELFPADPAREMAAAAGRGDLRKLDRLIQQGVPIDSLGNNGATPLWWTVRMRNKEGFRYLLERGANPNARVWMIDCIMDLAAGEKDSDFLQLALAHGADPNHINGIGRAPAIFAAVWKYNLPNIRILIASGANLNATDEGGRTVLVQAAVFGRYEYVFEMLRAGANPTVTSPDGRHSLMKVIARRQISPDHDAYIWREKVIAFLREKHGIEASKPVGEGERTKPMPPDLNRWPEQ
jgi:ankyrin repeat protein